MLEISTHSQGAPIPDDEGARLYNLRQFDILDTHPEPLYDDFARLAAFICQTPISGVSFVDAERLWYKAVVGVDISEHARDLAFCAHAILEPDLFIVNDASQDERFRENPFVTGEPNVRFYAGAPLTTSDGYALGSLCVIDLVPRELSPEQKDALRALGRMTVAQLEQRRDTSDLVSAIAERDRAQDQVAALQARLDALEASNSEQVPAASSRVPAAGALAAAAYPTFIAGLTAGALLGALLHAEPPLKHKR